VSGTGDDARTPAYTVYTTRSGKWFDHQNRIARCI
jgi:hypothetical protein